MTGPSASPVRRRLVGAALWSALVALLAAAALTVVLARDAQAASMTTWTGKGAQEAWDDPKNWDAGVPEEDDSVAFAQLPSGPAVARVPPGTKLKGLTLGPGGRLHGGDLTLTEDLTWTGGYIQNSVTLSSGSTSVLAADGVKTFSGAQLSNAGTMTLLAGDLHLAFDARILNTGTFTAIGGSVVSAGRCCLQPNSAIDNRGRFVAAPSLLSPGAPAHLKWVSLLQRGQLELVAGATLDLSVAPSTFARGTAISGSGRLRIVDRARVSLDGSLRLAPPVVLELGPNATLAGTATVEGGTWLWSGGYLDGTISTGKQLVLRVVGTERHTMTNTTLTLNGTTEFDRGETWLAGSSRILNRGALTLRPGVTLRAGACCRTLTYLDNAGTLTIAQPPTPRTGVVTMRGVELRNRAAMAVRGAELATSLLDARLSAGTLVVDAGTLRTDAGRKVVNTARLEGSGVIAGELVNVGAGVVSPGRAGERHGTLVVRGDYTQQAGGELVVDVAVPGKADRLTVSGQLSLSGRVRVAVDAGHPVVTRPYLVFTYASRAATVAPEVVRASTTRRPTFRLDLRPTTGYVVTRDLCTAPDRAQSRSEAADLLSCAEEAVPAREPDRSLSLTRQLYYGAERWSASGGASSVFWRDVIGCTMPFPNVRGRLGDPLLNAVHRSQVSGGTDIGHALTGLDAMRCPTRDVTMRIVGAPVRRVAMSNVEFATWGGDVGSAVAQRLAHLQAGRNLPWTHYFGRTGPAGPADMSGNLDAYAIRAAAGGACTPAGLLTPLRPRTRSAAALGQYYDGRPSSAAGARCVLGTVGAAVTGKNVTDENAVVLALLPRVESAARLFYGGSGPAPAPLRAESSGAIRHLLTVLEQRL